MRAFIALELPDPIKDLLAETSRELQQYNQRNLKWVLPENMHITFQFLGDINESHLPDISQIIEQYGNSIDPPDFDLPQLQLVSPKSPRILWVNYHCALLEKTHRRMCSDITDLGYRLDRKPLIFHVTLARIKGALQPHFIDAVLKYRLPQASFKADKLTLFQSILHLEGPTYHSLYSLKL